MKRSQIAAVCLIIGVGLLFWAIGVVTNFFANPAFSFAWYLNRGDASTLAIVFFVIAVVLVAVFLTTLLAFRRHNRVTIKA